MKAKPKMSSQQSEFSNTKEIIGDENQVGFITSREHHQYSGEIWEDLTGSPATLTWKGQISGSFFEKKNSTEEMPAVGDWVIIEKHDDRWLIQETLPRKSSLRRKTAGQSASAQVIAANLDEIWLISAVDGGRNFLEAFLERSLVTAWNSGATPVIILNKCDLRNTVELDEIRSRVEEIAFGVPVYFISALENTGLEDLLPRLTRGKTIGLLGKTGVGKSALINALHGDPDHPVAKTGGQRQGDLQGRHTTTSSRFFFLDPGAWIMDVPGLRELGLWVDEGGLEQSFPDIEALAEHCRFANCQHQGEPDCAVSEALERGDLEQRRFESWKKLQKELAYIERKTRDPSGQNAKAKWKQLSKTIRGFKKPGRDY